MVTNKKINNYNNKLSLKESSYFIKFDKKGSLYLNKDNKNYCDLNMNYITKLNQIKSNFQKENKIFTPKRNINIVSDKNSIFTFKSSDIYKNKKIFIL